MTYRPSTDPAAPVDFLEQRTQAKAFLRECGMARVAPPIHAADALYKLVGPDPSRVRSALAVLDLVEAALAADRDVVFVPQLLDGDGSVRVSVGPVLSGWDETNIDECLSAYTGGGVDVDFAGACRDLLAQLEGGKP